MSTCRLDTCLHLARIHSTIYNWIWVLLVPRFTRRHNSAPPSWTSRAEWPHDTECLFAVGDDQVRHVVGDACAVEVVQVPGKGRGLVATRDVPTGQLVLVGPALASQSSSAETPERAAQGPERVVEEGGRSAETTEGAVASAETTEVESAGAAEEGEVASAAEQAAVAGRLLGMCARDALVCRAVRTLDDGLADARHKPLPLVGDVLQRLSSRTLPLLPQLFDYVPRRDRATVSLARIERVCQTNSFGDRRATGLYPAAAYANHDANPSCIYLGNDAETDAAFGPGRKPGYPHFLALVNLRPLRKGDEITCRYMADPERVRAKWNIGD